MSSTVLKADDKVKDILTKVRPAVEKKCSQKATSFEPIEYRVSEVIGTMYLVKVDTGFTHNYLHVEIYDSPCGGPFLVAQAENNMRNDHLVPLVWRE
ncbi:stefin-3-like [Hypanus sabinus]|uniref:stefin-3-like n=1 Tax=Hypanus sabinus TaxID=79690 RepID=UPI0028C4B160|nr:stefin-3-like [Hypanus sabinus]XP_059815173.1 stefin-3-like [Hypanus sabinus]XP_059816879.1 stefin-3-like [Hypanus sabinus]XP_059818990.1 stefin-3-like [Hypanus sabinus]XP_059819011.1 stefin-3-like [Hypanus sabinus]